MRTAWTPASMAERRVRFEALYLSTYDALLGYALRRVEEPADAADVVAETFLTAWRRIDDVPPDAEARPWLFGVARRVLSNQRRALRRRTDLVETLRAELPTVMTTIALAAEEAPDVRSIGAAFRRVPEADREVLALIAWEGLDRHEVALVLGCSRATVRVRLHRARRRFEHELQLEGVDPQRATTPGHVLRRRASACPDPEEAL